MCLEFDVNQDYFHWLCEMVGIEGEEKSYWLLAKDLHRMPFYSLVPHDENRALDGMSLRDEYLEEVNCPKYLRIDLGECTMLEMLIALSRRIDYEMSDSKVVSDDTRKWFWEMLDNLGLTAYSDDRYVDIGGLDDVDEVLERLVERDYSRDGRGGLFPLRRPVEDQRNVEIWYQMSSYLLEKDVI